jgi:pimeloyl-ACP methyl ester carboxylesterase
MHYRQNATVILANGPWFDTCFWQSIVLPLQREGLRIIAAPLPFTSFAADVQALARTASRAEGPFILVGHSYAGAVISTREQHLDRAAGLVYLSAIVPANDETALEALGTDIERCRIYCDIPDDNGFLWAQEHSYKKELSPNGLPHQWSILEATQRPISQSCLHTRVSDVSWSLKPSWFFVSESDLVIPEDVQRRMAQRISAKVVSKPADHAAAITDPDAVIDLILDAVRHVLTEK